MQFPPPPLNRTLITELGMTSLLPNVANGCSACKQSEKPTRSCVAREHLCCEPTVNAWLTTVFFCPHCRRSCFLGRISCCRSELGGKVFYLFIYGRCKSAAQHRERTRRASLLLDKRPALCFNILCSSMYLRIFFPNGKNVQELMEIFLKC